MGLVLLIIVVLLLLGALPRWGYSRNWGYGPTGGLGLVLVIVVKEFLFRKVFTVGAEVGSTAVKADAWHHRSDAITSAAAFIGIFVAIMGGPGWQSADDWAAIVAAAIIFFNGTRILRPAVADLMDHRAARAQARICPALLCRRAFGAAILPQRPVRSGPTGRFRSGLPAADPPRGRQQPPSRAAGVGSRIIHFPSM